MRENQGGRGCLGGRGSLYEGLGDGLQTGKHSKKEANTKPEKKEKVEKQEEVDEAEEAAAEDRELEPQPETPQPEEPQEHIRERGKTPEDIVDKVFDEGLTDSLVKELCLRDGQKPEFEAAAEQAAEHGALGDP